MAALGFVNIIIMLICAQFGSISVKHALQNIKMIATSGFLTALECTKFVFGRGSAPNPAGGAYSAPPDPLAGLRGLTSKGGEERGGEGREEEGRGGKERGEEGGEGRAVSLAKLVLALGPSPRPW